MNLPINFIGIHNKYFIAFTINEYIKCWCLLTKHLRFFFFKNLYLPPLNQSCITDEKAKAINHNISLPSAHSIGKNGFSFSQRMHY